MTERSGSRKGGVLLFVLILTGCASIVIGAVVAYTGWSVRATRYALARDRCRLVAQSVIEQAKLDIQNGFTDYLSVNFASIQIAPNKAPAYNWFDASTVSGDRRSIGNPTPVRLFDGQSYPMTITVADTEGNERRYKVWAGIGTCVDHERDSAIAIIPIVATAVADDEGDLKVSATIQERVFFGTGQSRVFDNAYFVNNYGWMSGPFVINGEFRANGNVSLEGGATVNGFIYAAPNREIRVDGRLTTLQSTSICNQSGYRQSVGTRARYDTGNIQEMGCYNPAKVSGNITRPVFEADGITLRSGSATADGKPIVNEYSDPIEMPFVSDLRPYIDFAVENRGTLSYPAATYADINGEVHGTAAGTVNAHYSGIGPSGRADYGDNGSLLLIGTAQHPIVINGPVVVDGDVIIKGVVSGQGTIYAGRNVHIIGDITYKNQPKWTHTKTGDAAADELKSNESKDMLGIVAKGNVVIGDATSSAICNTISGVAKPYACDASDSSIGYASRFDGNYNAVEAVGGRNKVRAVSRTVQEHYIETYQEYNRRTFQWETKTRDAVRNVIVNTVENVQNRRYYETACDDYAIKRNVTTVNTIDAVIYNNHAVFGNLGSNFNINGALICRDEGLSANGGSFNWDMRLRRKKGSEVVEKLGLPVGAAEPFVEGWIELPDSENPAYVFWSATR